MGVANQKQSAHKGDMTAGAFTKYSFSRALRAGDSSRFGVDLKQSKAEEIAKAIECARDPTALATFNELIIGGKDVVSYSDYASTLVLRSLAGNVKYRARLKMPNRDSIVRGVIQSAEDATPMAIFRRDIESFYENVPLKPIRDTLLGSALLSPNAVNVLEAFLEAHCKGKDRGIPRGLSLSAVLAELAMQNFDQSVRAHPSIYRYFRFSDDILIFSYDLSFDVDEFLKQSLPAGLTMNRKKRSDIRLDNKGSAQGYYSFDYLGYAFHISAKSEKKEALRRSVSVTVARSKVSKIKSRIILSLKSFNKSGDVRLLLDRIKFLSSNYCVRRTGINNYGPKKRVYSGIFFNYRFCRNAPSDPLLPRYEHTLSELDGFLNGLLFGGGSEFRLPVQNKTSAIQLAHLKALSFRKGYEIPMIATFSSQRIGVIKAAWAHAKG
ncbi:antiviral reverse transcriptase Drt3a [Novosphingobium sp. B-7]|uniref:antiviral reverse transcriptase Drt3a n=1 Tax=Novosphingobium sp. B-7 TaxID=1298855 RepID=UPI00042358DE|nr:antiviral reverse transcriptase Drt3a [Novosphingobium sp. B-7]